MNAFATIASSSAVAGTLDLASALFLAKQRGSSAAALLRFVASGALGEAALRGGSGTAAAGLGFHYLIAVLWAAAYFVGGQQLPMLFAHPIAFGALYGIAIHLVMSLVVLPLSRTPKRPFAWRPWLVQLPIHVAFVGLPIALIQSAM